MEESRKGGKKIKRHIIKINVKKKLQKKKGKCPLKTKDPENWRYLPLEILRVDTHSKPKSVQFHWSVNGSNKSSCVPAREELWSGGKDCTADNLGYAGLGWAWVENTAQHQMISCYYKCWGLISKKMFPRSNHHRQLGSRESYKLLQNDKSCGNRGQCTNAKRHPPPSVQGTGEDTPLPTVLLHWRCPPYPEAILRRTESPGMWRQPWAEQIKQNSCTASEWLTLKGENWSFWN